MKFALSRKIILNFTAILVLPMVLSVFLVTSDISERARNEVNTQLGFTLQIVSKYFFRTINAIEVKLNLCLTSQTFRSVLEKGGPLVAASIIRSWQETLGYSFAEVYAVTGDSVETVLSIPGGGVPAAISAPAQAIRSAARGRIISAPVFPDEKRSYFRFVAPLGRANASGPAHAIALWVPIANDSVDSIKEITDIDVVIFNRDRSVISTRFDATGKRAVGSPLPAEAASALASAGSYRAEERYANETIIAAYTELRDEERTVAGYICALVPSEVVSRANMYVVDYLYAIMAISFLLACASGYFLSLDIVRPLGKIARLAGEISEGNFTRKISVDRSDEIGELAGEFNKMGDKLAAYDESVRRRVFEVSTLYEVSRSMNFLNNKEQILNIILTKTIDALNSEKGSIMLYNPEECMLSCEMAVGYPGKFERRVKFAPGQGKAGEAFQRGEPIISNDIQSDGGFLRTDETRASDNVTRNLMCIPMKSKDEVIGVINVVNKKTGDGFNEYDQALACSLASQAAMTIENARLYELSITDGMTKLFIHRYFQIRLEEEMKRSVRYGTPVSLVMTDIDHFKKFNDTYGHQVGDMVLIKVADIMRDTIRNEVDIPCRYGGEEFAVIAPQTGRDDARRMAERLRSAIEGAVLAGPGGKELRITISLGISTFPDDTREKKDLILKADAALYYSKEHGRNRFTHFGDIPPEEQGNIGHKQH